MQKPVRMRRSTVLMGQKIGQWFKFSLSASYFYMSFSVWTMFCITEYQVAQNTIENLIYAQAHWNLNYRVTTAWSHHITCTTSITKHTSKYFNKSMTRIHRNTVEINATQDNISYTTAYVKCILSLNKCKNN